MAAPELRLEVSLGLNTFRSQMRQLVAIAQAEFNIPLNVRINRNSLDKELNSISRAFSRRTYRLDINDTSVKTAIIQVEKLRDSLDALSRSKYTIDVGVRGVGGGGPAAKMDLLEEIFGKGKETLSKGKSAEAFGGSFAGAVGAARAQEARRGLLQRIGKSSLSEGGYNLPGLKRVITELGGTPSGKRADLVAQAKELAKSVDDAVIERAFANLKDLQMSLKPIRGTGAMPGAFFAARSAGNYQDIISSMAGLTKNPRAAGLMLRQLPEERIKTNLLDVATRQAQYYENVPLAREMQRSTKGFDPLLKAISESFADYTKSLNPSNPWIGKIGGDIQKVIAVSAQSAATKLLPGVGGTTSPVNSLVARLAGARGGIGTGGATAGLISAGAGVINPGVRLPGGNATFPEFRKMANSLSLLSQSALDARKKINEAGFQNLPTAITGLKGAAFDQVLNRAVMQSRGMQPFSGQMAPIFQASQGPRVGAVGSYSMYAPGVFNTAGVGAGVGSFIPTGGGGGGNNVPPPRGPGGTGAPGGGGAGNFGSSIANFGRGLANIQLPGQGTIREFGDEFKYATQQVLLFGTAYKALAFFQNLPAQVGQAVADLQNFRNTLKAISPTAQEAAASNQLILDLVDRYNIPLQSARDGFTKLYASMQPAGFAGEEIRDLFVGISKAAATYGMSADKVDRVTYAFAQMASKGQVMSEELKGQLGDVLPGAMGIFAKAAGFEGPGAIEKFSKALEDGAYKGEAMRALLKNVTIQLNKEFGPGAEGAATTFQGVMNRMQNSMRLFYESFEPVAVGFLNTFVIPVTDGIKQVTDGLNAFFSGSQAKTVGGAELASQLTQLQPSLIGIGENLKQLVPLFQTLGMAAAEVGKIFLAIAGNPVTGYLAKLYAIAFTLNVLINTSLVRGFVRLAAQLVATNAQLTLMSRTAVSSQVQMALLANGTNGAAFAFSSAARQVTAFGVALRAVISTTVVGFALVAIGMLIDRMQQLRAEADAIKNAGKGARQQVVGAYAGGREAGRSAAAAQEKEALSASKLSAIYRKLETGQQITAAEKSFAEGLGARLPSIRQIRPGVFGPQMMEKISGAVPIMKARYGDLAIQQAQRAENIRAGALEGQRQGETQAAAMERQLQVQQQKIQMAPGKPGRQKKERESQVPQLQLELEKAKELLAIDRQIGSAQLAENTVLENSLQLRRDLTELAYEGKAVLLERIPAEEKQLKIAELQVRQQKIILESQNKLQLSLQADREKAQKTVESTVEEFENEYKYQKRYYDLINSGINPELAKARIEVEKRFDSIAKELDTKIEQLEVDKAAAELEIAKLEAIRARSPIEEKQLEDAKERLRIVLAELKARGLLKGSLPEAQGKALTAAEATAGLEAKTSPSQIAKKGLDEAKKALAELLNIGNMVVGAAKAIGDSFAQSFKDVISGSQTAQQALASFFQRIGDYFLDMVARMISAWLQTQLIQGLGNLFGLFSPSGGAATGASSPFSMAPGSVPAAGGISLFPFANGGIASGGFVPFRKFANGGTVSGPTLGLVGEGRYNEAIVPLPDGKSIPVELGGAAGNQIVSNITVNVNNGQTQSNATGANSSELGRKLEGAVKQVIVGELRPGGLLSR